MKIANASTLANVKSDPYYAATTQRISQTEQEIELLRQELKESGENNINDIRSRWNAEREPILKHIALYQKTLGDIDSIFENEYRSAEAGVANGDEARIKNQLAIATAKLNALENSLIASGYSEYQPIGEATESHHRVVPQSNAPTLGEKKTGNRGRPKGSLNKKTIEFMNTETQGAVKSDRSGGLVSAIQACYKKSGKSEMRVVELAEAIREYCDIDAKTSNVLTTINRMVDTGSLIFNKDARTYTPAK